VCKTYLSGSTLFNNEPAWSNNAVGNGPAVGRPNLVWSILYFLQCICGPNETVKMGWSMVSTSREYIMYVCGPNETSKIRMEYLLSLNICCTSRESIMYSIRLAKMNSKFSDFS
jgi:hypothetical protein